jgi:hypothetical protein
MNSWNENNFLDRLMPHLQQKFYADRNHCPEADTICAVVDGEASAWIQSVFAEHLTQCPQCSELYRRMCAANSSSIPEQDAEWTSTEKRLGNWFDAFLASKTPVHRQQLAKSSRSGRRNFWEAITAWRIPLAVSAAGVLVLVAAGLLIRRPPVAPQPIAEQRILQPQSAAVPTPQTSTPPKPSATISNTPLVAKGNTSPENLGGKHGTASARLPEPGAATGDEIARGATPTLTDPSLSAPVAKADENRNANAKLRPPPSGGTKAAALVSPSSPSAPAGAKASLSAGATPKLPISFRLESGTRLWISLRSVDRQSDGNFRFVGTLLLPVSQGGSIRLDRGTEVHGTGSANQKQVSVVIGKLVVQGVPYAVTSAPLEARPPGSGIAVQFNSGQELEMWLASTSVFARAPGEAGRR